MSSWALTTKVFYVDALPISLNKLNTVVSGYMCTVHQILLEPKDAEAIRTCSFPLEHSRIKVPSGEEIYHHFSSHL